MTETKIYIPNELLCYTPLEMWDTEKKLMNRGYTKTGEGEYFRTYENNGHNVIINLAH